MRFLLLADIHLSERPPSSCTDTYTDDLFDLLAQAAAFAVHCEAVVIAGDVFHSKAPSRTSHKLVMRLVRALRAFSLPVYVVPGNHDLAHDNLDSLRVSQPLGVLVETGVIRVLQGWARRDYANVSELLPLYGVPWLQHWTDEAVSEALAAYREQVLRSGMGAERPLVVTHAPLYPEGQELKWEHYPARKFADAMGMKGHCFYGHVHEPHEQWGFYDEKGEVTFCNYGALSRGSLHEYNLTRQVGVTVWDSETGVFEFVPLHARPAAEVFRLSEAQEATTAAGRLDEFLAGVAAARLGSVSAESVLEHLRAQDGWGPAEQALAEELLAEAAHG